VLNQLGFLVLSAGEGRRMKSSLPKVLHEVAGRPLLAHVFDTVHAAVPSARLAVVIGHHAPMVRQAMGDWGYKKVPTFLQPVRRGSGDAVRRARRWLSSGMRNVVVLCGDAPLIRSGTLRRLIGEHKRSQFSATVLSAMVDRPAGYGRRAISEQKKPREVNRIENAEKSSCPRTARRNQKKAYPPCLVLERKDSV